MLSQTVTFSDISLAKTNSILGRSFDLSKSKDAGDDEAERPGTRDTIFQAVSGVDVAHPQDVSAANVSSCWMTETPLGLSKISSLHLAHWKNGKV